MKFSLRDVSRALVLAAAVYMLLPLFPAGAPAGSFEPAWAGGSVTAEKDAFEAAKALGTVEAWDAFLSNYPTGFHADLARAYVKKLAGSTPPAQVAPPPAQPVAAEQAAYEQVCAGQQTLRSRESREPAKIRFINESGTTLILQWIDFNGALKEYATLPPGADMTQDTYITHPWIIAYMEGSCRQIFLPAPGSSVARLRPESGARANPAPPPRNTSNDREPRERTLKCGKNYKKVRGECVLQQNCGANAYRSAEGDCYCKKNYEMSKGKCRWKQDKQGFEVAPWKKPGCNTWQKQCNQGNADACGKYESTCQVN